MKKKLIIITIFIVLMGILLIFNYNNSSKEDSIESIKSGETKKYEKMLTMMLETGNKTGEYKKTTASKWPTSGYRFNTTLSKCENGGELSWDDTKKTVVMMGTSADKCYVYFDKFSLVSISNINNVPDYNSVKVTINTIEGYYDVSKYYFKIDDGNYIENDTKTYTFNNLNPNTRYTICVKIIDTEGNETSYCSDISTLTHTIEDTCSNGSNLVDCLKTFAQNYTLSETNMYYHDSTLANGAGDNSYRYAGTNPPINSDLDGINNFVCVGSDVSPCPIDNLYRILGLYNKAYTGVADSKINLLKLVKFSYVSNDLLGNDGAIEDIRYLDDSNGASIYYQLIGEYLPVAFFEWNSNTNNNTWSESNLNLINLNTNFINNLSRNASNIYPKILDYEWRIGGNTNDNLLNSSVSKVFESEVISPSQNETYIAKIGLLYASDYLYASAPSNWTNLPTEYNNNLDSWLYMGVNELTITKISDTTDQVVRINKEGYLERRKAKSGIPDAVRPVFFLYNVGYSSGDGSYLNPIRLSQ